MKNSIPTLIAALSVVAALAVARAQAPSPEADSHCRNMATQATGYVPGTTSSAPDGSRVRGAARGAAVGGIVGGDAGAGAAAGMAVAGSRQRQERRGDRRSADAWQNSYNACMASGH